MVYIRRYLFLEGVTVEVGKIVMVTFSKLRFKCPSGMLSFPQLFHIAEEETYWSVFSKICKMLPCKSSCCQTRSGYVR